jgi:serine/threonine protein kinase
MMELLGRMPKDQALIGKRYKRFFDRSGHLRRIRGLNYWPLKKVLVEKYKFKEREAQAFADFLVPMLDWNPEKRASAQQMLDHPWLKMPSVYDTRMNEEEMHRYLERQTMLKEYIEDPFAGEEMSKLEEPEPELNAADLEDNDRSFFSDLEDDAAKPYLSDDRDDDEANPKEYRDIAEGKNLNNSFVGPYPENWDHLHIDKGANPQFMVLNDKVENNIFELA